MSVIHKPFELSMKEVIVKPLYIRKLTGERLMSIGQGVIMVGRFTGDGVDIPYNTLRAAKARRIEN